MPIFHFVEDDDQVYLRTEDLFAGLQEDLSFYTSEGKDDIVDYIIDLAGRIRISIMRRENE